RGGAGLLDGFVDGIEHRKAEVLGAALSGRHAADHLRAIGERLTRMERAGLTRHPLRDDPGVAVDEDAHAGTASARLESICWQATSNSFNASHVARTFRARVC